jgi:hypothetical protein
MVHRREASADRVARGRRALAEHGCLRASALFVSRKCHISRRPRGSLPSRGLPGFGVKLLSKAPCQGVFEASHAKRNGLI